ncbi:hypothetical protein LguiA_008685 [Lonicera macranthoides]
MASLKSGVLVKLLENMNSDEKGSDDDRKPVLLQIRSIVPVLEEGNLWPNRGFYLKVCDFTHAIYVCLPQEQNEMILSNKLKLGQFIYVQKLEAVSPVPMLKGITLLPGRRPCEGTPEDIFPSSNLVKFLEQSDTDSIVEKSVISEKKIVESSSTLQKFARGLSDSEALMRKRGGLEKRRNGRVRSSSASKAQSLEGKPGFTSISESSDVEKRGFEGSVGPKKEKLSSVDNDSDSDCSIASPLVPKRRSWTESEFLAVKEIYDSSVGKKKTRPLARSRSANVSPVRSVKYDSSDDNLSISSGRRDAGSAKKLFKSPSKSNIPASNVKCKEALCPVPICSLVEDRRGAETGVAWDSLPSSLAKLGKEVIKQRDVALLAAIEALQEACASERLIRCLSTYSEFQLADVENIHLLVDKFLNLQDDLAHTRLIMQSLTNISPLRTSDTETTTNPGTVKEVLKLAVERKKNATSWIKSAIAVDLSPHLNSLKSTTTATAGPTSTAKKSSPASNAFKPKGMCIIRTQRRLSLEDEHYECARGSTLWATADLAVALQDECRRWFLGYVEKYLDEVENRASMIESDGHILSEMMYKIKRVNDWLEVIVGSKESCSLSESETEACGRIKDKIYGILLKNVARTAMALGNMNASA